MKIILYLLIFVGSGLVAYDGFYIKLIGIILTAMGAYALGAITENER